MKWRVVAAMVLAIGTLAAQPRAGADARSRSRLEQAYAKERALLVAEKRALAGALASLKAANRRRAATLRREIKVLMAQVMRTRVQAEALEAKTRATARTLQAGRDKGDTLRSVFDHAIGLLGRHGVNAPTSGDKAPKGKVADEQLLTRLVGAAVTIVRQQRSIRRAPGRFFNRDGKELRGQVIRIGQIAAVGTSGATQGVLAPAGAGALKIVTPPSGKTDPALATFVAGKKVELLSIYLFDPLTKNRQRSNDKKGVVASIKSGGIIVWPILALGLLALLLAAERFFTLKRINLGASSLVDRVMQLVEGERHQEALVQCERRSSAVANVLGATLRSRDASLKQQEDIGDAAILAELPRLLRFLPTLHVIAAVAPLLGLLGTVTGMITTFGVITEHGTGDPKLLSGGISEALMTTELGLIVAIPVLLLHALLASRANRIASFMEVNALRLRNALHHGAEDDDEPAEPAASAEGSAAAAAAAADDDDEGGG